MKDVESNTGSTMKAVQNVLNVPSGLSDCPS